jgi:Saposin-like type B, region 2
LGGYGRKFGVLTLGPSRWISTTLVSECQSLVGQYAPAIIQLLINKENPDTVCQQIHLCKTDLKDDPTARNVADLPIV